jgi:hypothetical protein
MSTAPTTPAAPSSEFEFNDPQNQLIGGLSRKMALVGFVMIFFGLLQMINGVTTLFMTRNPTRVLEAAKTAGMTADQLVLLEKSLAGGFASSPLAASAVAFALAGLLLLMVGIWTRQAASGFAGIVLTQGKDITRLMDALSALNQKYTLIYSVLLVAALFSLLSLAHSLWHTWRS